MAISMYDKRTMLEAVQQMKWPKTFLYDLFFAPRVRISETEYVDVDLVKGTRRLAPIVSTYAGGKLVERQGFTTRTYQPPMVAPRTVLGPEDLKKRMPGENVYTGQSMEERSAALQAADLVDLGNMITRRIEWMCSKVLTTGTLPLVGEGVSYTWDFEHTLTETLTSGVKWSETSGVPMKDLQTWRGQIIKATGISPNVVVMGSDAASYFINHTSVQNLLDITKVTLGRIDPQELPNGATFLGTLRDPAVDIYRYDAEWYLDDITGVETAMFPADLVVMGSTNADFRALYGAYYEMKDETTYAVERYPRTWVEENLNVRYLEMISRPFMLPADIDSWFIADVC